MVMYVSTLKWNKRQLIINGLLCLCLLGFLIPVLLSGVIYSSDKFDSSHGCYSNVILPADPLGVITGNSQLSKRADFIRRGIVIADSITAVFRIKNSVQSNNNLFFNCFVALSNSDSQQFFYSLLDIPPPVFVS